MLGVMVNLLTPAVTAKLVFVHVVDVIIVDDNSPCCACASTWSRKDI